MHLFQFFLLLTHFNMVPEDNTKPVLYSDTETWARDPPAPWTASYTSFCSWCLWTWPSLSLEHPSQLVAHLMLSYAQVRKGITSFLRRLLANPSEKPNNQHPPPQRTYFSQHPFCFLKRTPHNLKISSWFTYFCIIYSSFSGTSIHGGRDLS